MPTPPIRRAAGALAALLLMVLVPVHGPQASAAGRPVLARGDADLGAGRDALRPDRGLRPRQPAAAPRVLGPEPARVTAAVAAGHVVVRFADGLPDWQREQVARGLGGGSYRPARSGRFARVEVPPGTSARALVERLRAERAVVWAELDPLCRAAISRRQRVWQADHQALTDPLVPFQWTFERIRLAEALPLNRTDGAGVIVAVIDSGVASGNGAAFPARRGLDLEGTRFASGFDFVDRDPNAFDEGTGDPDAPETSPRFGHGTFVTSLIAATVNNGVAGASIAPDVTILPIRVLDVDGFGSFSTVAEAIDLAVERGARVVNMSLGAAADSQPVREAVRRAHRAGVVLVAASGNEAEEGLFDDELGGDVAWPARYPEVIAVGATGFDDRRAGYSNFGRSLDLVAPAGNDNEEVSPGVRDGALATSFLHDPQTGQVIYAPFFAVGTSFSAPQVAGAAALLVALGVDDPDAVRAMLEGTARDLGEGGNDAATGHGLVDLLEAHRGLGLGF